MDFVAYLIMDLIRLLTNRKEKPYDRKRVDKTLGPWSAFKGPSAECIPGTRLPRKIVWHRPRLLFGRKREEIDFAIGVMTHWLRLEPKLMRFIAYFLRDTEKYKVREIPRPGREPRRIEEPMALLKFVQRRILRRILEQTDLPDCVHGFVRGRSIGTAAAPHAHKEVVVCCDIENFFPTITVRRVWGVFRSLIVNPRVSNLLAALTTYQGRLPQGAPTSPMIANLVLRRLDRRLAALTRSRGIEYTRYADDMIFSGGPDTPKILKAVRAFVAEEGFTLNEKKTRILRRGRRQEVCGLVVNERVGIPRLWRRRLRAEVHRLATGRDGAKAAPARLRGELAFLQCFHPEEAGKHARKLLALLKQ
ncbi:MAG TPA: reverse transcriptase family protein [Planctomycetota bacterium]|nr:RNA-directed DNA polymerase [Planctomycetota bacterium]OQC21767.1 MAG: Reverse transcriptase (RNA-dependent DNA polymerase) [Planctomycetes bacterium ADurb.Bin069]NMD34367.1 RNA-directed DNA polymerase [Planctomycetota bacterium]HNS00083.1 reverse transcriptase family protein [Planctomycetota bacterium]HNU26375.1 reverse transcriptase family protein [Planctomycetota bacterium]